MLRQTRQRASILPMDFLPHHFVLHHGNVQPVRTAYVVHGILGSGRNLRTFIQKLSALRPHWRFVLLDLRNHGDSTDAPAPHTLQACARDVAELSQHLAWPVELIIGHSFGGKVALQCVHDRLTDLKQVIVLDATPQMRARTEESRHNVERVIAALQDIPQPLQTRQQVARLLLERGFANDVAQWMTTNLRPTPQGFVWKFDLHAVDEMMASYFALDFWPLLRDPPIGVQIDFIRAQDSDRWTPQILQQFSQLDASRVRLHTLADAGHWLHVDQPDALARMIAENLRI